MSYILLFLFYITFILYSIDLMQFIWKEIIQRNKEDAADVHED